MEQNKPSTGEIVRALIESYDEREHGTVTEACKSIVIRALTEQQKQIAELTARAEQAEKERDAAVADMKYGRVCMTCKHDEKCRKEVATTNQTQCIGKQRWEWRGLPQEGEGV